jgi:hypothetical protein
MSKASNRIAAAGTISAGPGRPEDAARRTAVAHLILDAGRYPSCGSLCGSLQMFPLPNLELLLSSQLTQGLVLFLQNRQTSIKCSQMTVVSRVFEEGSAAPLPRDEVVVIIGNSLGFPNQLQSPSYFGGARCFHRLPVINAV